MIQCRLRTTSRTGPDSGLRALQAEQDSIDVLAAFLKLAAAFERQGGILPSALAAEIERAGQERSRSVSQLLRSLRGRP